MIPVQIKIAVMGYKAMAELFKNMTLPPDLEGKVSIQVYDALFEKTLEIATKLEQEDAVDVFFERKRQCQFH